MALLLAWLAGGDARENRNASEVCGVNKSRKSRVGASSTCSERMELAILLLIGS